ncbi:MAG: cation diffusion facilitator family transporter [Anaerolineales bacterium]|nr:cation diffusion facilitator family transporter [Anaerolineales bacterium]
MKPSSNPRRFAWLAIAAAVLTISLKGAAAILTGSVSLLSDALESTINLTTAVMTLIVLFIVARPEDDDHTYGHGKAEYLSSGAEGGLILAASAGIIFVSVRRLINPLPVSHLDVGLVVIGVATLINLIVATLLIRVGRRERSVALEADGRHLMTDVWTSVGVIIGVLMVYLTGIVRLDPIIAILFGANIAVTGIRLMVRSTQGLMDSAVPKEEVQAITATLDRHAEAGLQYHALRTRQSGSRSFASFHIQVPGEWTVQRGHDLLEQIDLELHRTLPYLTVFSHIEPMEDPRSFQDIHLDRPDIDQLMQQQDLPPSP